MKKLLSILAAVGLTATASAGVVACGSSESAETVNMDVKIDGENFTISSKDPVKVDLASASKAAIEKGADVPLDAFGKLVFADKDGKKFHFDGGTKVVPTVKAADKIAVGATSVNVNFAFTINKAEATKLGLLTADGKAGKDLLVKLGTANKDGNLDKEFFEFTIKASSFVAAK